jgi:hypothetical protein
LIHVLGFDVAMLTFSGESGNHVFFSAQMSFLFCVEILLLLWVSVPGCEETLRDAHEQFGNILNPECRGLACPCPAQIFNLGVHIQ